MEVSPCPGPGFSSQITQTTACLDYDLEEAIKLQETDESTEMLIQSQDAMMFGGDPKFCAWNEDVNTNISNLDRFLIDGQL
jgi:hypothetical protein